jgi:hypothetical protein
MARLTKRGLKNMRKCQAVLLLSHGNSCHLQAGPEVHFLEDAGSEGLQARRISLRHPGECRAS